MTVAINCARSRDGKRSELAIANALSASESASETVAESESEPVAESESAAEPEPVLGIAKHVSNTLETEHAASTRTKQPTT